VPHRYHAFLASLSTRTTSTKTTVKTQREASAQETKTTTLTYATRARARDMTSKAPLVKARPFPLSLFVPLVRSSALLHLLLPVGCRPRTLDTSTRNSCSLLSLASSSECPSVFNLHISSSKYHLSSTLVHAQCAPSRYQTIRHTGVRSSGIGPRDS